MVDIITLSHGSGGQLTNKLINDLFIKNFDNEILSQMNDSAVIKIDNQRIAFTTDTYVISPLFFLGGDIGKLAICGTVNDLSMVGAKPIALSCGFIIEEGLERSVLEKVVKSMRDVCKEANVKLVTGDTKVVNRGGADKLFINTSGIGIIDKDIDIRGNNARVGDKIILSGNIGEHGTTILLAREDLGIQSDIMSDVAPLNKMVEEILKVSKNINVLRDPTRGGIATTLNEIAYQSNVEIEIDENLTPVSHSVCGVCGLLGLDPLYMANEGKLLCFVSSNDCDKVLNSIKNNKYGKDACVIGEVKKTYDKGRVYMTTKSGSSRIINKFIGDNLPRIC